MKPFKCKKEVGGQHHKIFIRSKLPRPKAPLTLFVKVHKAQKRIVRFELEL